MKSLGFIARKPDLSPREYVEHYETHHAPLADRLLSFERYRRNHIVGGDILGFATVAEFWADGERIAGLMAGDAGDRLRADELTFMNKPESRPAVAEQPMEAQLGSEVAVLLFGGSGEDGDLAAAVSEAGGEASFLTPFDERPMDFHVAVFMPRASTMAEPAGWKLVARADAIRFATINDAFDPAVASKF